MLKALADGETPRLWPLWPIRSCDATQAQLCDALGACTELNPVYRRLLKMALEELQFLEQQIVELKQEMASLLREHQDSVKRLAETPGLGVDSAQQIMAEVGATAATFPSAKQLSSCVHRQNFALGEVVVHADTGVVAGRLRWARSGPASG
jgi:transposase